MNQYESHSNLINPNRDVEAIAKELREAYACSTESLINATQDEFLTALHGLAARDYDEKDELLVFFSGHGFFDEGIKRGYLAFRDSLPLADDPFRKTYVSHGDVRSILERLDCHHVLLIVDSCFSGTLDPVVAMATGGKPIDDPYALIPRAEYLERKLAYRTRRYITAGGKEYVPDGRPGSHSPFARKLLEALRSYGGSDGILTLEELLLYLERVDPEPRTGELFGNEPGSSFVFVAQPLGEEDAVRPRKFGSLVVHVTPADANVRIEWVNQTAKGFLRTLSVERIEPSKRRYHLPIGDYRIHATRQGYASTTRNVAIKDASQTLQIDMKRK